MKTHIKNSSYYILGFLVVIILKYYFITSNFNLLKYILTPTAQWVRTLTNLEFIKETNIGYVNHQYKFIIATSCSGINFMVIVFSTIYFTFINKFIDNRPIGFLVFSFVFSYFYTILINGIRIALSIYAPIYIKFISPEDLHTILGTTIFFVALLIAYNIVNTFFTKSSGKNFVPLAYYIIITVFIPLVIRFYSGNFNNFLGYCTFIFIICFACIFALYILKYVANRLLK